MRTNKKVLATAVGIAMAALGTAAFAGQFTGPDFPSSPKNDFATENFGPANFTAADHMVNLPAPRFIIMTTGVGASGGYAVNNLGSLFVYWRFSGATVVGTPPASEFFIDLFPGGAGAWVFNEPPSLSTDGTTLKIHLRNVSGATQVLGTGAIVAWMYANHPFLPSAAARTPGDFVTVTGGISAIVDNVNAVALPTDVDSAGAYTLMGSANAIAGAIAANASPLKIAVDAVSQRRNFLGGALANQLGRISWSNLGGIQHIHNIDVDYVVTNPAGRLMSATVTAGAGSFNAGNLRLYANSDCTGLIGTMTLNAAKTQGDITGVTAAAANDDPYVCYVVSGTTQINEVTGITATSTLLAPPGINDQDRSASGNLGSILNDGTVIDTRIYIPAAVNQFGFGMSLRIINNGSTDADVFAQYIYADGSLSAQGKIATAVKVGGYVMLENTAIEAAIGAPDAAKGPNPRVRVVAPTSDLRVQTFMRTNGVWAEVSGGMGASPSLPGATNQ